MIIKSIHVKNFRSIQEVDIQFDNPTVLLGRNGAGKSCILRAIEMFYNIAAPVDVEDFHNRDQTKPIEITITFHKLRPSERTEFQLYIRNDELMVSKNISFNEEKPVPKYFAATMQIQEFAAIRSLGKREKIIKWNDLVDTKRLDGIVKCKSAEDVELSMNGFESAHPEIAKPINQEVQFFGQRNIGGGKLDKFTRFVFIPAVRDASDEVAGRKGAIEQLLDMLILRNLDARDDVKSFKKELEAKAKQIYCTENLTELPALGKELSDTLGNFSPGARLNLQWGEVKPPEVVLPATEVSVVEDGFEGKIERKGHGLQRALILTLLKHLALNTPIELTDGEAQPDTFTSAPDLILAIEEPELYLHPSRCRYMSQLLLKLAGDVGGARNNQIIYTTHSPFFVDLDRFDQVRIVKKERKTGSPVPQTGVCQFPILGAINRLAEVCSRPSTDFTKDSFKAHSLPVMNTAMNEGFFGNVVVVVEGPSEVGMLWKLQEIMKKNWDKDNIVVVPAGGKNNIDRPTIIFNGFSIPTYFVFDGDLRIGKQDEARIRNNRYLRMAGVPVTDFPETSINYNWAVFQKNIEAEIEQSISSATYQSIRDKVAGELGYDDPKAASKNIEVAARIIEEIYKTGKKVEIMEKLVEKVSALNLGIPSKEKI